MPVPDFSPGEVLTASAMDSIGLWLVKSQAVGTGVSSVTVTDAFSADYDNYKIIYTGGVGSTTTSIFMRLGSTTTQYYMMLTFVAWSLSTYTFLGTNNLSQWSNVGAMDTNQTAVSLELLNPFLSKYTLFSGMYTREDVGGPMFGVQKSTTSFTSFTLTAETGTLTGGTIRVYGYRN